MTAYIESTENGMDKHFRSQYGPWQIELWNLATHPDYQRKGHGSTLCRWGMKKAQEDNVAVTLMAAPMGKLLYAHLGFRFVGSGVIEVPGDPEKGSWELMDWDPKTHDKLGL